MKFLHTADWQIGMKASGLGKAGSAVKEARIKAASQVMEEANRHQVDFILVAGDTFEDNGVDRLLVQQVADILGSVGRPVYLIPGNHDPFVPGSVWEHPAWKSAKNVTVITKTEAIEIPGGSLFPCPLFEKYSSTNPTAWIPQPDEETIRIGLAHGTVEGIPQDTPDYPIPRDASKRCGLDYLALGHWHSTATYPGEDGAITMAYAGTHETTKFGERDSGNVLLVEISAPKTAPMLQTLRTGKLEWISWDRELALPDDIAYIHKDIETQFTNPLNILIQLTMTGIIYTEHQSELEHLEQVLQSRFLSGRLDASQLRISPADDSWIQQLPPGILQAAALRIQEKQDISPEMATRALIDLYAISQEAKS